MKKDVAYWRKRYEDEHARRCALERRFDHRLAGVGVVERASVVAGRCRSAAVHATEGALLTEAASVITDLILLANARTSEVA